MPEIGDLQASALVMRLFLPLQPILSDGYPRRFVRLLYEGAWIQSVAALEGIR